MRWERLALAAIAGAIGGYLLAKRQEPDIDWLNASEPWGFADEICAMMDRGELIEWDGKTILQTVIEDEF